METDIDELSSHLSTLKTTSNEIAMLENRQPISTFILPSMSSCPMATDNYKHLLIYHHQTLILFSLPKFDIIFSIPITPSIESSISDICFHSILNCFLLSSSNSLYSLSSNRQIEIVHKFSNIIWSITHTSKYIFICYLFGFSIEQWEFNTNSGTLVNTWFKDSLIESLDIGINCIRAVNQHLGMTVKENNFSWRIDIFDILTMNKIRRGKTIQQENDFKNWIGILYPIDPYQWLFADGDQGLYLIDQTDEQEYKQNNIKK
ncbi:unnamed protein product [Rotaria sp. Silwood1]|nr:unnamed protein product [Rotaria sp. Silwood1]CAF1128044.1 unnamed protein product [Rotaria sp. Silwood1]CAF3466737.1 unnamed protein product [Rotaria sp. Silwood1]CAF3483185.1 unnamed protein product [Rotaria sp. Silwood1]CAF4592890.1 unnamed protein product [Rotaria sp. Silwood1]